MKLEPVFEKNIYRAKKGDTAASIAEQFATDVRTLRSVNNITEPYEGLLLLLSRPPRLTHKVMPGDTLGGIAAKYHTTPEALLAQNKISRIFTGLDLIILP